MLKDLKCFSVVILVFTCFSASTFWPLLKCLVHFSDTFGLSINPLSIVALHLKLLMFFHLNFGREN
jgi:hypothetical protein